MICLSCLKAFAAYILGSIPVGPLLSRVVLKRDLKTVGSGNTGATNVMRLHKGWGLITLIFDALKGFLAVYGVSQGESASILLCLVFVVLGHIFPVWLGFKGGKGVATYGGGLGGVDPTLGLTAFVMWILGMAITRISSCGSLLMAVGVPVVVFITHNVCPTFWTTCGLGSLILWRHRSNIQRLLQGAEPKIGQSS